MPGAIFLGMVEGVVGTAVGDAVGTGLGTGLGGTACPIPIVVIATTHDVNAPIAVFLRWMDK